ncbi:DUF3667 domain-containing protein [Brevundimonas sp.]|uniref:DUF3667 domain-containing protein n=1 Tax=Brevundimonas sp. TaxID=1871086 RepID=UPI0035AF7DEA
MEIEGAGAAVTAGLAASALERPTGASGEGAHGVCSDCGHAVEGNFCSNCGQPTHVHRSLLHLVEELLHGVMHFDGRVWRTVPLLFINPGRLTREWIQGKRSRYVSPLALFLFTIFLMFFALSFAPSGTFGSNGQPAEVAAEVERDFVAGFEAGQKAAQEGQPSAAPEPSPVARADGLTPGTWQAQTMDALKKNDTSGRFEQSAQYKILKKLGNPDFAVYKLQQTLYKFAFLLVPMSVPFVALLFLWRRGVTLYDHGVFVLYSLTFIAILAMALFLLCHLGPAAALLAVNIATFGIPIHMFAQMKGAYSLGVFSALWRTAILLIFCHIIVGFFLTAILYLGLGV